MEEKKLDLIDQIEQRMILEVKALMEKEPNLLDDPLSGPMRLLINLNESKSYYRENLITRKNEMDLTKEEIDIITKTAYTRVYEELFDS